MTDPRNGSTLPRVRRPGDDKPRKDGPRPLKTTERDIERACSDLLKYDGWRMILTDPPQLRGLGVSEKGIPDRLYIRYGWIEAVGLELNDTLNDDMEPNDWTDAAKAGVAELLWIEWKRPGGKASRHQLEWIRTERARGALVWLAGVDFVATHEGFLCHYRNSGLNRRPI